MLKRLFTLVLVTFSLSPFAQNGFTFYSLPSGYSIAQTRARKAFVMDHSDNVWVGFAQIGLGKFDGSIWTMYDQSNSPLPNDQVNAIAFDAANKAWIGTQGGAASFDGAQWTLFNTANSGLAGDSVLSVALGGNKIYLGTTRGLSVYNGSTWITYKRSASGLPSDTVYAIAMDPNGTAWVGTSKGLSSFSGSSWTNHCGGSVNPVSNIFIDAAGDKWLGSSEVYSILFNGTALVPLSTFCGGLPGSLQPLRTTFYCKGPHGGTFTCYNGAFYEFGAPANKVYYPPSGTLINLSGLYLQYQSSTNKVWMLVESEYAQTFQLASFDATNYNGLGLGLTFDNIKKLDINEVSAVMLNRGDMHWDGRNAGYEVPKGSGINSDFASALWIGGLDNSGTLHQAAMTYRQNGMDFWPGPLDTLSGTGDSLSARAYDRIFKIDRFKIAEFIYNFSKGTVQNGSYIPDRDILDWPAAGTGHMTRQLAPYIDVNHNGMYDPLTGGDYPDIKGDEELYWIFNDNLAPHTESGGKPLNVEVHSSAYAYTCPTITDSLRALNYTTFYHLEVYNRSGKDYHDVYLGHWQDPDLGSYNDDAVGSFPEGNYGYVYNGTLCDGPGSAPSYGCAPPMMSTVILDGPPAVPGDGIDNNNNGVIDEPGEKNLMTGFLYYNNDFNPVNGNPASPDPYKYYDYLSSRWEDSTHMTVGGYGVGGSTPTNFMWPDFPYDTSGWSEKTAHITPGDRRFLMSCGPFNLKAGAMASFDFAFVWSRDTSLINGSKPFFDNNLSDVNRVKAWFTNNNAPSCLELNVGIQEPAPEVPFFSLYPNPANETLNIDLQNEPLNGKIEIRDLSGRVVTTALLTSSHSVISVSQLSEGLYFVRMEDGKKSAVKKFVKRN